MAPDALPEIYNYRDYKTYLRDRIDASPSGGRGIRSALSTAIGCQIAYVSRVLNGDAHFSLEQADSLNRFLSHLEEEGHFFILLVEFARAGTQTLRSYFERQIERILEKRLVLHERLDVKKSLSKDDQFIYYNAWYYSAIHIILTIPEFQRSPEKIARHLGLTPEKVTEVFDFLISVGLVVREKGKYLPGLARIHLSTHSLMYSKHHTNWRIKAIESLNRSPDADLHYSSVVSLSESDVGKLKSMTIEFIQNAKNLIKDSPEESLHSFSTDFFRI
jgi:uncharacterized protein (TIGR02147 family)